MAPDGSTLLPLTALTLVLACSTGGSTGSLTGGAAANAATSAPSASSSSAPRQATSFVGDEPLLSLHRSAVEASPTYAAMVGSLTFDKIGLFVKEGVRGASWETTPGNIGMIKASHSREAWRQWSSPGPCCDGDRSRDHDEGHARDRGRGPRRGRRVQYHHGRLSPPGFE